MPNILAIETSVPSASLALYRKGEFFQYDFESHRQQNQLLFPPLKEILSQLNGETIDTIVIGSGPGSYSGSRIAIAAAQGLATAHGSELVTICSFCGIEGLDIPNSIAVGDARRNSYFYCDLYKDISPFSPTLLNLEDFLQHFKDKQTKRLFTLETQTEIPIASVEVLRPTAKGLISYWLKLSEKERYECKKRPLEPLYLRAPFITKSTKTHPLLKK